MVCILKQLCALYYSSLVANPKRALVIFFLRLLGRLHSIHIFGMSVLSRNIVTGCWNKNCLIYFKDRYGLKTVTFQSSPKSCFNPHPSGCYGVAASFQKVSIIQSFNYLAPKVANYLGDLRNTFQNSQIWSHLFWLNNAFDRSASQTAYLHLKLDYNLSFTYAIAGLGCTPVDDIKITKRHKQIQVSEIVMFAFAVFKSKLITDLLTTKNVFRKDHRTCNSILNFYIDSGTTSL